MLNDPAIKKSPELQMQELRESLAIAEAQRTGKCITYIDTDGCEITATPSGHAFYNAADWY